MTALLVTCGMTPEPQILSEPWAQGRIQAVDMYDLVSTPLGSYDALFLSLNSDQRELCRAERQLTGFLAGGGTIVFCGHVAWPFLPGLTEFVPLGAYRLQDLEVTCLRPHPVFEGVVPHDLTYRRGVAGFYGRGSNPLPPGARAINAVKEGTVVVDFEWHPPQGGRLLAHAGIDLWGLLDEDGTAERIPPQLLGWALAGR